MRDTDLKIGAGRRANTREDLEDHVRERSQRNLQLPALIRAAERRRLLAREMAALRVAQEKSQTLLGATIGTSQSAIARLESGAADTRFSTLERYAAGLGYEIEYKLIRSNDSPG